MQPSEHPARTYMNALFDSDEIVCITLLSAEKTFKNGQPLTVNKFIPVANVTAPAGIARLTKLNETNHIFCSMCSFVPGSKNRIKSNIARVANVFIEADERGPEILASVRASVAAKEIPPCTVIVESSPNKFQFIWSVDNCDIATQVALNRALAAKFGTDMASTDCARVLRLPSFRNLKEKYGEVKPVAQIVEYNKHFLRYEPEDFCIPLTVPVPVAHAKAEDAEVQGAIELLVAALDAANVSHGPVESWSDAYKIVLTECGFADNHTNGMRGDSMVGIQASGKMFHRCLHGHCVDKDWHAYRKFLEARAGRKLRFKVKKSRATA